MEKSNRFKSEHKHDHGHLLLQMLSEAYWEDLVLVTPDKQCLLQNRENNLGHNVPVADSVIAPTRGSSHHLG